MKNTRIKTFEDILNYRFSRYGHEVSLELKSTTRNFFETIINEYLRKEIKSGYHKIDKDLKISSKIENYKIKEEDFHNLSLSNFGGCYFNIIDE